MADRTQRLRDPIHGLIVFDEKHPTDMLAWQLIQTPEFQRLRRIKQLGVSEFVFPGASHSRFAHSIGVYHNARKLMRIIEREEKKDFKENRAQVALIAALLHDIGHGPFSHAFEGAREDIASMKGGEKIEKHERFSASLVLAEDGGLRPLLDAVGKNLAADVAQLIASEDPIDIYHAVVSSSFDADRLDYLVRDRYMTGTASGSIDVDWLIDTLSADHILVKQDNDTETEIATFAFKAKGRQAAEDFLLARHRLYTQVYLHKTTRGFERILGSIFCLMGDSDRPLDGLGLDPTNPLVRFLRERESLETYRRLDDTVVWSAIEAMAQGKDKQACELARRLWQRERPFVLDLTAEFGPKQDVARLNAERRLDAAVSRALGKRAFKDTAPLNLYSSASGDDVKAHKMVRVRIAGGAHREITEFEDTIISPTLMKKAKLTRFYFLDADERDRAAKEMEGR